MGLYGARNPFMQKKYIVRLTGEERSELREVIKKLAGTRFIQRLDPKEFMVSIEIPWNNRQQM
jgi:hypothetical protein